MHVRAATRPAAGPILTAGWQQSLSTTPGDGGDALGDYQFDTMSGHHQFCAACGVRVFGHGHIAEIGGDFVSIQIATLDDATPEELAAAPVNYGNGRDNLWWERPSDAEVKYL